MKIRFKAELTDRPKSRIEVHEVPVEDIQEIEAGFSGTIITLFNGKSYGIKHGTKITFTALS